MMLRMLHPDFEVSLLGSPEPAGLGSVGCRSCGLHAANQTHSSPS